MVSFILMVASVTLYALSGALCAYAMIQKVDRVVAPAKVLLVVALVSQSVSIGLTSASTSGTLVAGPNILMLASWVLALVTLLLAAGKRFHGFVAFASPLVAALIVASQVLRVVSQGADPSNQVYYEWPTLVLHISLFFLAAAAFVVGASASVMQLYQQKLMKQRSERLFRVSMPAVSTLSTVAKRSAVVGTTLFTAGMLIGFARFLALYTVMAAVGCEGSLLYLVPRMVLSVAVWAIYVAYLVLSYLLPCAVSSRVRAWISVAGLALTVVLIVVSAG